MRKAISTAALFATLAGLPAAPSLAQQPAPGTAGVVVGGSSDVSSGGLPAARGSDQTATSEISEGSPNVTINGRPAATVGDRTNCGGVVVTGSSNVLINGKPMARLGDRTSNCPTR